MIYHNHERRQRWKKTPGKLLLLLLSFSKWALWSKKEDETFMFKKSQKFKKERVNHEMFIPKNPS